MKKTILTTSLLFAVRLLFAQWTTSGTNIYNSNTGNVAIGATNPGSTKLYVNGNFQATGGMVVNSSTPLGMTAYFLGNTGVSGNIVVQGQFSTGAYSAYWITGTDYLKIGGNGGTEPALGAINIGSSGNVGIGVKPGSSYKMDVEGTLGARAVQVTLASPWPDYVFNKNYPLPSLDSLSQYLGQYHHLPDMPAAAEVAKTGIDLGANQTALLKKIEELTLYILAQDRALQEQTRAREAQDQKLQELKERMARLEKLLSQGTVPSPSPAQSPVQPSTQSHTPSHSPASPQPPAQP